MSKGNHADGQGRAQGSQPQESSHEQASENPGQPADLEVALFPRVSGAIPGVFKHRCWEVNTEF